MTAPDTSKYNDLLKDVETEFKKLAEKERQFKHIDPLVARALEGAQRASEKQRQVSELAEDLTLIHVHKQPEAEARYFVTYALSVTVIAFVVAALILGLGIAFWAHSEFGTKEVWIAIGCALLVASFIKALLELRQIPIGKRKALKLKFQRGDGSQYGVPLRPDDEESISTAFTMIQLDRLVHGLPGVDGNQ